MNRLDKLNYKLKARMVAYEECAGLKFEQGIIDENKRRLKVHLLDVWYSLHPGSKATYLATKLKWPHHD